MHAMGIVHRNVKPSRIMITDDNKIKVIDFGVSKKLENEINLS